MSILRFSDGDRFVTSGHLRKELRRDGWYAIGQGFLIPVASEKEEDETIQRIRK